MDGTVHFAGSSTSRGACLGSSSSSFTIQLIWAPHLIHLDQYFVQMLQCKEHLHVLNERPSMRSTEAELVIGGGLWNHESHTRLTRILIGCEVKNAG